MVIIIFALIELNYMYECFLGGIHPLAATLKSLA